MCDWCRTKSDSIPDGSIKTKTCWPSLLNASSLNYWENTTPFMGNFGAMHYVSQLNFIK